MSTVVSCFVSLWSVLVGEGTGGDAVVILRWLPENCLEKTMRVISAENVLYVRATQMESKRLLENVLRTSMAKLKNYETLPSLPKYSVPWYGRRRDLEMSSVTYNTVQGDWVAYWRGNPSSVVQALLNIGSSANRNKGLLSIILCQSIFSSI